MTYTQQKQLEVNALAPCNCDQSIELENTIKQAISTLKMHYTFSSEKSQLQTIINILQRGK